MSESSAASPPPLGHLVAALSESVDLASLARVLTGTLADALPADLVHVQYQRSVSDRFAGRRGTPTGIDIHAADKILSLRSERAGPSEASISHHFRGIVLSRTPVDLSTWLTALADELRVIASTDEAARQALEHFLLG